MYIAVLCLALMLLITCAHAADPYQIRPLSEADLMDTYTGMMLDSCRFSNTKWHDWSVDPTAGYWGDGVSAGNQGIRAISDVVLTSAALLKYSNALKGAERKEFLRRAIAGIRYSVATHVTGKEKCVDGKQWGNSWQSGMWVGTLAFGTWLIWDELDAQTKQDFENVVAFEADRFLKVKPPSGRWHDTKAEENGWDLTCISVAANMFPSHPRAAAWNEKAIEYMMNVLSVRQDKKDNTMVDGRPVSDWNCTENMHPDFTLENHNMLHPSYIQCSSYFLTECAMHYAYGRRPVPQAASHHLMDAWRMFQTLLLPSGETAYPQGQDWELHGLNPIQLFAALGTVKQDPLAAKMERINVQYMRSWQKWCNGSLAAPGSSLGFTRHAIQGEQATWSYLAHKVFGAATKELAPAVPDLVKHYTLVDVIMHRTNSKFVSMSWKNRLMGVIVPKSADHAANPFFGLPIANGLIGMIERAGMKENTAQVVSERQCKKTSSGFETSGTLKTNGGAFEQRLRITSIGDKTVIYQDRVIALADVTVAREMGVPIGIENDQVSGGKRTVYYTNGQITFDWKKPQQPAEISGQWANVDGRLGIVAVAGSGIGYVQAQAYNAQGVHADILSCSYSSELRSFRRGDEVAHRIAVIFTEVTPEQTGALSKSIKTEGRVLNITLPEGGQAEVTLL